MFKQLATLLALLLAAAAARADVMVLVHGYLGDAESWESSGVTSVLAAHGWHYSGQLTPGTRTFDRTEPRAAGGGSLYAVNLPSAAPLVHQSDLLWMLLQKVFDRHPGEPLVLVGHSAGGVVARLALVRHGHREITTLVTIASPHLGTPRALDGLQVIQDSGPFELLKELVGGSEYRKVKRSGGTLWDLSPPRPGNLLFWLNEQKHPEIRYVSVVRLPDRNGGDQIVPVFSQDMNQVVTLRGKAEIVRTFGDHYLERGDGRVIAGIVQAPSRD